MKKEVNMIPAKMIAYWGMKGRPGQSPDYMSAIK